MKPHLMTKAEYLANGVEYVLQTNNGELVSFEPIPGATVHPARTAAGHAYWIRRALAAGEEVPPEVLAEYPGL